MADAPKITLEYIEAQIVEEDFFTHDTLTVCVLTLANGFKVTGESACAAPENFDAEIGRRIARDNARDKIWALEGYRLRDALSEGDRQSIVISDLYVASVVHAVNRAYASHLGESQPAWDDAPDWMVDSALDGVHAVLENPDQTAEQSHENWLAHKRAQGWKYGPVKDVEKLEHPCMVPWQDLPPQQRLKDALFVATCKAMLAPLRDPLGPPSLIHKTPMRKENPDG